MINKVALFSGLWLWSYITVCAPGVWSLSNGHPECLCPTLTHGVWPWRAPVRPHALCSSQRVSLASPPSEPGARAPPLALEDWPAFGLGFCWRSLAGGLAGLLYRLPATLLLLTTQLLSADRPNPLTPLPTPHLQFSFLSSERCLLLM